jgi:alkyl sulfatase BDS1-like metallo-beta-lactamase superfamily hydrolase
MSTRRDVIKAIPAAGATFAVAGNLILDESPARAQAVAPLKGHFHPKGKAPSKHTMEVLRKARATLPFTDTRDFDENKRGLIAPMPDMKIMADAGHVAWDMERFKLRTGIPQGEAVNSSSPDVIRAMTTELFLNFLGIRMDSRKAEGLRFTINLVTPDNGEKFVVEMANATLTNIQGFQAPNPDLTLTINRSDLEQVMAGQKTLEAQIAAGVARVQGDASVLQKLAATMVDFDPRFEILPGTKQRGAPVAHADAYQAVPRQTVAE